LGVRQPLFVLLWVSNVSASLDWPSTTGLPRT